MDEILPSDPSIYWTVFTAVVGRNLKVRPLKWKLLKSTTFLWYCFTLLQSESGSKFSFWIVCILLLLYIIDLISILHWPYMEPTSALHWPHMDPTSPAHGPMWFLPILRFTLRFSMKIQNKLKRTKCFGILERIGWSQNFRNFGIKRVQNPQVWKGLLC